MTDKKITRKQYKRIDEYTVIRDNVYKIKMQEYIDDLYHIFEKNTTTSIGRR